MQLLSNDLLIFKILYRTSVLSKSEKYSLEKRLKLLDKFDN